MDRARSDIEAFEVTSSSLAVGLNGEIVFAESFGDATPESTFAVFSCTKAVVAGVVWALIGDGLLDLSQRVEEVFEGFGRNGKDPVTLEMLLTHTAGFPRAPLNPAVWGDAPKRAEAMRDWRLNWEPGTRFEYHPTSAHWVIAKMAELVTGEEFCSLVRARLLEPMGVEGFYLGKPADTLDSFMELVAYGELPSQAALDDLFGEGNYDPGEVTPEALLGFNIPEARAAGLPGGGGVSTASALALYYQGLLHNSKRVIDPAVLADGTSKVRCRFPDPIFGHPSLRTAGISIAGDDGFAAMRGFGKTVSPATFGHMGAGGQIAWADPSTGLSFCYLTNGIDRDPIREARRTVSLASRAGVLLEG